jgi:hypothetical protein
MHGVPRGDDCTTEQVDNPVDGQVGAQLTGVLSPPHGRRDRFEHLVPATNQGGGVVDDGVGVEEPEVGTQLDELADDSLQGDRCVVGGGSGRGDGARDVVEGFVGQRMQQVVAGGEVPVDGGSTDPGGRRHLSQRGTRILAQQLGGSVEHGPSGAVLARLGGAEGGTHMEHSCSVWSIIVP